MSDVTGPMPTDAGITRDELIARFNYDPHTGTFARRSDGKVMGCKAGKYGRIQIDCGDRMRYASRLAWLYVHGEWPNGQIDHINGDHTDNRIANLRVLSNAENCRNKSRARKTNSSGLLGVSHDKRVGKYRARIMVDGRMTSLGYYDTPEAAHAAYLEAKRTMHPTWAGAV